MPSTTVTTSPSIDSSAKKKLPEKPILILLSGGDPAGIAPEVIRKALASLVFPEHVSCLYFYNAGHADTGDPEFVALKHVLGERLHLVTPGIDTVSYAKNLVGKPGGSVHLVPLLSDSDRPLQAGKPEASGGAFALRALDSACSAATAMQDHRIALVTAPLSKEWVIRSGETDFSGHTGYLARRFHSSVLMLMHGMQFSVIPLTEHVPLANVPDVLRQSLQRADLPDLLFRLARSDIFRDHEIAICGLNPHSGEGGLIGREEEEILFPFIERLRARGVSIQGPLPADTLFMESVRKKYRLILACYHDQGLIPFKAIEGKQGINVTFGLPFLRTSPDHGTAFDLAGRDRADPSSMIRAFEAAYRSDLIPGVES